MAAIYSFDSDDEDVTHTVPCWDCASHHCTIDEIVRHLQGHHQATKVLHSDDGCLSHTWNAHPNFNNKNKRWPASVWNTLGQTFLLRLRKCPRTGQFYLAVQVLGNEELASRFSAEILVQNGSYSTEVLSIDEELDTFWTEFNVAIMDKCELTRCLEPNDRRDVWYDRGYTYLFPVTVVIKEKAE